MSRKIGNTRFCFLQTQKIREDTAKRLQGYITQAEKMADKCQDEKIQREWLKLAGFLQQILTTVLRAYDEVRFQEDFQKLEKLFAELKQKQAQLEAWEHELRLKEEELNRKLAVLEKSGAQA